MFSYFNSSQPEPAKTVAKVDEPYPDLGKEYHPDHCWEELISFFEGRDPNNWEVQYDEPNFKQNRCYQEDRPVLMMNVRTTLKCPVEALLTVSLNFETRMAWDKNVVDMKTFEITPDMSAGRIYYRYLSPAPYLTSDRDFYIYQLVRRDFPEVGMVCIYTKSLPTHPECPETFSPCRANMYISAFVFKPVTNEHGEEHTEMFMVTQVDINGWVPKLIINNFSASKPRESLTELEAAASTYHKSHTAKL